MVADFRSQISKFLVLVFELGEDVVQRYYVVRGYVYN